MINIEFRFLDGHTQVVYDVHPRGQEDDGLSIPANAVRYRIWPGKVWVVSKYAGADDYGSPFFETHAVCATRELAEAAAAAVDRGKEPYREPAPDVRVFEVKGE